MSSEIDNIRELADLIAHLPEGTSIKLLERRVEEECAVMGMTGNIYDRKVSIRIELVLPTTTVTREF